MQPVQSKADTSPSCVGFSIRMIHRPTKAFALLKIALPEIAHLVTSKSPDRPTSSSVRFRAFRSSSEFSG